MSRPRFLADEDLRGSIIHAVRRMAFDLELLTVVEAGLDSVPDDEILEFAWRERWLVASHDVNTMKAFAEMRIAAGQGMHGLFLAPQRAPVRSVAESLRLIWEASEFEEWQGRVVYLPF